MALTPRLRRAGALALVAGGALAAACTDDPDVRGLTTPAASNAPFLLRYVALGNSITAGFQSNGINDSTQRASYANLLARAAGVRFAYPALLNPGCPPPLTNLLTGARVGGSTSTATTCPGRSGATDLLNNVAVPGANSFDPTGGGVGTTAGSIGGYGPLTRVILGNRTQVERAVEANPTFASVWLGNNDVLSFALGGDSVTRNTAGTTVTNRVTAVNTFVANYAATINQLVAGSPGLRAGAAGTTARGVLIGVVDVTNTPQLFQLSAFNAASAAAGVNAYNPAAFATLRGLFGVGAARPATFAITFNANCNSSQSAVSLSAIQAINAALPAAATGYQFNCAAGSNTPVLDDGERTFFTARVAAYNAYIRAKADSVGFFYYDPNVRLAALKASGAVPPFPNLTSATQPFGPNISLDGVHPSTLTHLLLARDLRDSLNAKYGSTIVAPDTAGLYAR